LEQLESAEHLTQEEWI
jgi:adenosine deaminase CECR1